MPAERLALQEADAKQARGQVWTRSAVPARSTQETEITAA